MNVSYLEDASAVDLVPRSRLGVRTPFDGVSAPEQGAETLPSELCAPGSVIATLRRGDLAVLAITVQITAYLRKRGYDEALGPWSYTQTSPCEGMTEMGICNGPRTQASSADQI